MVFFWGARRKAVVGGGGAFLFAGFAIRVVIGDAVRNVSTMPPLALAPGFAYAPIGRRFGNSCKPPPPCHSRLRAGILGGLVRGIALPPRLLSSLPTPPRVPGQARNDGANAPFVLFCLSPTPLRCHSLVRQSGGGSAFRASIPSRHSGLDPESWAACAGHCAVPSCSLCTAVRTLTMSFRPPSRNPLSAASA